MVFSGDLCSYLKEVKPLVMFDGERGMGSGANAGELGLISS